MLDDDLRELRTAEEFLDYFGVEYDPQVVQVNRLRLLKRFHDYIETGAMPSLDHLRRETYARLLDKAYQDCRKPRPAPVMVEEGGAAGMSVSFVPLTDVLM